VHSIPLRFEKGKEIQLSYRDNSSSVKAKKEKRGCSGSLNSLFFKDLKNEINH
jgi:hypothetical protein